MSRLRFHLGERKDIDVDCMSPQVMNKLPPSLAIWANLLQDGPPGGLTLPMDDHSRQARQLHFTTWWAACRVLPPQWEHFLLQEQNEKAVIHSTCKMGMLKKKMETLSIRLNHKLWLKPPDFFPLVWLHLNFSPTPSLYHRTSDAVCFEPNAKQVREVAYLSPKFKQIGLFYSKNNCGVSFTTWTQN